MNHADRIDALRRHARHRRCNCDLAEIEQHLDHIETMVAELLARIPAPDNTPASVTLTAS